MARPCLSPCYLCPSRRSLFPLSTLLPSNPMEPRAIWLPANTSIGRIKICRNKEGLRSKFHRVSAFSFQRWKNFSKIYRSGSGNENPSETGGSIKVRERFGEEIIFTATRNPISRVLVFRDDRTGDIPVREGGGFGHRCLASLH